MGMRQLKECLQLEDYSSVLKRKTVFSYETSIFMCLLQSQLLQTRGLTLLFIDNRYPVGLRHKIYLNRCQVDVIKQPKTKPVVN
jgi:hypothetical protein